MANITLYVVHHQDIKIPVGGCLCPISSTRTDGDNIADKTDYCELRAHYWVWKNETGDPNEYVGFFHYRRYLDFKKGVFISAKRSLPYCIRKCPSVSDYTAEKLLPLIGEYDVIAPVWEYTGIPVLKRYGYNNGHRESDLTLVKQIIAQYYPNYLIAAEEYLSKCGEYYANMFVMRRSLFEAYCEWLFDILEKFDQRAQFQPPKTDGYLGERLFGIYFTWLRQAGFSCGEVPRVHFSMYDDENHLFLSRRVINILIPPGSRMRALLVHTLKLTNIKFWR